MPETVLGLPTQTIIGYALNIVAAIVILVVGFAVAGWAARLTKGAATRARLDETIGQVLGRLVRSVVVILTILAILNRFGFQTTSLVALLGAAGLAIGLALQGTLGSVASGVMILALRPFKLGDLIEVGGTLGVVEDIGLFVTRITTPENIAVHLPNSNVWGTEIKNLSQNGKLRLDMVFGIGYGDDIDKAISVVNNILAQDPNVLKDPAPTVAVGAHGASSVDLWVRPWVAPAHYWDVYLNAHRRIKDEFDKNNISIPFPQRDVHVFREPTN